MNHSTFLARSLRLHSWPPLHPSATVLIQILVTSSCLDELRILIGFPAHRLPTFYSWPAVRIQFSCSVTSSCLQPHGLQQARLPCPSPTPRACSNSCPSSRWYHPTSHPLSSPSPPAFSLSQCQGLFRWVSSSHQVAKYWSFSFSISPSNEYSGLISSWAY